MDERLKKIIDKSDNIVFFGGAGVSTESNIPDFRSESGLYKAMNNYGRSPEEMLSHSFFVNHTETFFDYYKNNLIYTDAKPNPVPILKKGGYMPIGDEFWEVYSYVHARLNLYDVYQLVQEWREEAIANEY